MGSSSGNSSPLKRAPHRNPEDSPIRSVDQEQWHASRGIRLHTVLRFPMLPLLPRSSCASCIL